MYKEGRLTIEEMQFIEENATKMTYVAIAEHLNRKPTTIKTYIQKIGYRATLLESTPIIEKNPLEKKDFWPALQEIFTPAELQQFVMYWNNIQKQFNYDILPTEEMQVVDVIKLELMGARNLKLQRDAERYIESLTADLNTKSSMSPQDIALMKDQQNNSRAAVSKLTQEYLNIQDKKSKLFQDLKATRSARISHITSDKKTFVHWIEDLMSNPEKKRELGLAMEKFRLAMIDETVRLAAYNKYENGSIDQPLLNSDTVKDDNEL